MFEWYDEETVEESLEELKEPNEMSPDNPDVALSYATGLFILSKKQGGNYG